MAESPSPQAVVVVRSTSSLTPQFVGGQPLLCRDEAQADGSEGELQVVVTLDPQASTEGAMRVEEVVTGEQRAIRACSEVVLPWPQKPDPHAIESVLDEVRRMAAGPPAAGSRGCISAATGKPTRAGDGSSRAPCGQPAADAASERGSC